MMATSLREASRPRYRSPSFAFGSGSPWEATQGTSLTWQPNLPPRSTALGALLAHITGEANAETFQPMNVNFGLFQPLICKVHKDSRPQAYTSRALTDLAGWTGVPLAA